MTAPFDWAGLFKHAFSVMRRETPGNRIEPAAEYIRTRIEAAFVPVETHEAEGLRMAQTMLRMTNALEARAEAAEARNKVLEEALREIAEATSAEDDAGENYRWDDREGALDFAYATATAALGGEHE